MTRILVVDDDEQICALVARLLENDGYQVDTAHTGLEALGFLKGASYQLMLLDLVMPQKGGIETIMDLRREAPQLPIVIMSGMITLGDASVTRLIEHYGAMGLLAKPFTADDLRKAVNSVLPGS